MRAVGIEPTLQRSIRFKSCASTSFATPATVGSIKGLDGSCKQNRQGHLVFAIEVVK